jgi:hypothetical protein
MKVPKSKPLQIVPVSEDHELYIKGHYNLLTRKELARRLGIDKITLNLMILQLGFGE